KGGLRPRRASCRRATPAPLGRTGGISPCGSTLHGVVFDIFGRSRLLGRNAGRSPRRQAAALGPPGEMRIRRHHLVGEADARQEADGEPGVVDFPPAVTMARRARVGVMVVVPAFAVGDQADDDVVAAVLVGLVIAVAPYRSE